MTDADISNKRLTVLSVCFLAAALVIVVRLVYLQIWQYGYYSTLALSTHEIEKKIHPVRGEIYFRSAKDGSETPAAVNAKEYLLYAVPKEIKKEKITEISDQLTIVIAHFAVRRNRGGNRDHIIAGQQVADEANALDIGVAVFP